MSIVSSPRPLERFFARVDEVCGGEVVAGGRVGLRVAGGADAAFGGDEDAVAHAGDLAEDLAEDALGFAAAVDVGVVEEGVAGFVGGDDGAPAGGPAVGGDFGRVPSSRYAPAAVGQPAAGQRTDAKGNGLHRAAIVALEDNVDNAKLPHRGAGQNSSLPPQGGRVGARRNLSCAQLRGLVPLRHDKPVKPLASRRAGVLKVHGSLAGVFVNHGSQSARLVEVCTTMVASKSLAHEEINGRPLRQDGQQGRVRPVSSAPPPRGRASRPPNEP